MAQIRLVIPHLSVLIVCVFVSLILPAFAMAATSLEELTQAERDQLGQLLERAKRSYDAGEFATAADALEQAYTLLQEAGIQRRLGDMYEKLEEPQKAIKAYTLYLKLEPDVPDRKRVEGQIALLRKRQRSSLRIKSLPSNAAIAISPNPSSKSLTTPSTINLPAGDYTITLTKPGFSPKTQTVHLEPGRDLGVILELSSLKEQESQGPPTSSVVFGSIGVASLVVSGLSLAWAYSIDQELDTVEESRSNQSRPADYNERARQYNRLQITSVVAAGVGVTSLTTALLLWVTDSDEPSGLTLHTSPVSSSVSWTMQF